MVFRIQSVGTWVEGCGLERERNYTIMKQQQHKWEDKIEI